MQQVSKKGSQGFASMSKDARRQIASKGGKRAHELGLAYQFTPEAAKEAGRRGGVSVSQDREHMRKIGSLGGKRSAERRKVVRSEAMT